MLSNVSLKTNPPWTTALKCHLGNCSEHYSTTLICLKMLSQGETPSPCPPLYFHAIYMIMKASDKPYLNLYWSAYNARTECNLMYTLYIIRAHLVLHTIYFTCLLYSLACYYIIDIIIGRLWQFVLFNWPILLKKKKINIPF